MWQEEFRILLQAQYKSLVAKNPSYSLRAFARKLKVSPGTLSDLIAGKRKVTPGLMLRILRAIKVSAADKKNLMEKARLYRRSRRVLLPAESLHIVSKWIYFSILCAYECRSSPQSTLELSQRLGVSENHAQEALDELLRLGLLTRSVSGEITTAAVSWTTVDGTIPIPVIRESHLDGLQVAQKALLEIPPTHRDFTSLTLAANSENLELAREEIRKFKDRLAKIMHTSETNSVFRLNVNFFPVDQWSQWNGAAR